MLSGIPMRKIIRIKHANSGHGIYGAVEDWRSSLHTFLNSGHLSIDPQKVGIAKAACAFNACDPGDPYPSTVHSQNPKTSKRLPGW